MDMRFYEHNAPDFAKTDESRLRFTALLDATIIILLLLTKHWFFIVLLLIEFAGRVFHPQNFSVLPYISNLVIPYFNIPTRLVYKAPKTLNTRFGLCMAIAIGLSLLLSYLNLVLMLGLTFIVSCIILTAYGICPVCYFYSIMNKYRLKLRRSLQYERLIDHM